MKEVKMTKKEFNKNKTEIVYTEYGIIEAKDLKVATLSDMMYADLTWEYAGLDITDGKYSLNGYDDQEFDSQDELWDALKDAEIEGFYCADYWDGCNWKYTIIEEVSYDYAVIEELYMEGPPFTKEFTMTFENGKEIRVHKDNISGQLSPFYYKNRSQKKR